MKKMNRMTVYDQTRLCFKVTTHQEPGRSVIQELGIYEDIHEEEIKKATNITDIRDLYFTKGAKLDPYWENLGKPKTERSGWIPVTERLPEVGSEVLVCFDFKGKRSVYIANFYRDGEFHGLDDEYLTSEGRKYRKAVAWQPLPESYKGE